MSNLKQEKFILIVDDEEEISSMMSQALERAGYNTITADNGLTALKKIECAHVDLIITDYKMPKMDGKVLIHELRQQHKTKNLPIFILSGHLSEGMAAQFGDVLYIPKPVKLSKIVSAVDAALNSQEKEDENSKNIKRKTEVFIEISKSFVYGINCVFKSFNISEYEVGQLEKINPLDGMNGDVSVIATIRCDKFTGKFCLIFDKKAYLDVLSIMLMEECNEVTEENQDAVAEISCMLLGNVKKSLEKYNFNHDRPIMVLGNEYKIYSGSTAFGLGTRGKTKNGQFFIKIIVDKIN